MTEKSEEIYISYVIEPPEFDADEEQLEKNYSEGIYEASKNEIIESCGNNVFKNIWLIYKKNIINTSINRQRIFAQQMLDKIYEVYDFNFSDNITLSLQYELDEIYQFIEFIEYNNNKFLLYVWNFLKPKKFIDLDIETYCKKNRKKIIKEIDEQLEIYPQSNLATIFLESYYKEKLIEWFIKNSKQHKTEIAILFEYKKTDDN